ncbi:MAG TPA: 6-phosphogluconolactonase [Elusimicrobiota bacterium]|nr:6-phosphogluconolactonase [Elusimicrobiota bacterium]
MNRNFPHRPRKIFSVALSALFWLTQLDVLSVSAEFWTERQQRSKTRSADASSSPSQEILAQLSAAKPLTGSSALQQPPSASLSEVDRLLSAIPDSREREQLRPVFSALTDFGVVRSVRPSLSSSRSSSILVFVQDVHGRPDVQKNIALLIRRLAEMNPGLSVGLEGAVGRVAMDPWRLSSAEVNRELGDVYLNAGLFSGAEAAALMTPTLIRMVGVEQKDLYLKNVSAARAAMEDRPRMIDKLDALSVALTQVKQFAYSPALKGLEEKRLLREEGTLSLPDYLLALKGTLPLTDYPQVARFLKAHESERGLDIPRVENDRQSLLTKMVPALSKTDLERLLETSLALRTGNVSYVFYHRVLIESAAKAGLALKDFPYFERYVRYVTEADGIQPEPLFGEVATMDRRRWDALCETAEQREASRLTFDLADVRKLVGLEMTRDDWERYGRTRSVYKNLPGRVKALSARRQIPVPVVSSVDVRPYERFYEYAEARNKVLADNLRKLVISQTRLAGPELPAVSVLIAGGYHAEAILRMLNDRRLTVAMVVPKQAYRVDTGSGNDYLDVFTRGKLPLDRLYESPVISLAPDLLSAPLTPLTKEQSRLFQEHVHSLLAPSIQSVLEAAPARQPIRLAQLEDLAKKNLRTRDYVLSEVVSPEENPARRSMVVFIFKSKNDPSVKRFVIVQQKTMAPSVAEKEYLLLQQKVDFYGLEEKGRQNAPGLWSSESDAYRLIEFQKTEVLLKVRKFSKVASAQPWRSIKAYGTASLKALVGLTSPLVEAHRQISQRRLYRLLSGLVTRRYDPARVYVEPDHQSLGERAAEEVLAAVRAHPDAVIILPTGSTPIPMYRSLIRRFKEDPTIDLSKVSFFNLDEYIGLSPDHPLSYRFFMDKVFYEPLDKIDRRRAPKVREVPVVQPGKTAEESVRQYEELLRNAILSTGRAAADLVVLGIGGAYPVMDDQDNFVRMEGGHIGFNEPGPETNDLTPAHVAVLSKKTIKDTGFRFSNIRSRPDGDRYSSQVPTRAMTLGIADILHSHKILFMANGEEKAFVVRQTYDKAPSPDFPASYLKKHKNVVWILDRDAGSQLPHVRTPWRVSARPVWSVDMIRHAWVEIMSRYPRMTVAGLKGRWAQRAGIPFGIIRQFGGIARMKKDLSSFLRRSLTTANDSLLPRNQTVLVTSPHPDDDIITMAATIRKLVERGNIVHISYMVSGENAVRDADSAAILSTLTAEFAQAHAGSVPTEEELKDLRTEAKKQVRENEAMSAIRRLGIDMTRVRFHFMRLPYYYMRGFVDMPPLDPELDVEPVRRLLNDVSPDYLFYSAEQDPHGAHGLAADVLRKALDHPECRVSETLQVWGYRGAYKEWPLYENPDNLVVVPFTKAEMDVKTQAIAAHQSQLNPMFPSFDRREFWQRARDRNRETGRMLEQLGYLNDRITDWNAEVFRIFSPAEFLGKQGAAEPRVIPPSPAPPSPSDFFRNFFMRYMNRPFRELTGSLMSIVEKGLPFLRRHAYRVEPLTADLLKQYPAALNRWNSIVKGQGGENSPLPLLNLFVALQGPLQNDLLSGMDPNARRMMKGTSLSPELALQNRLAQETLRQLAYHLLILERTARQSLQSLPFVELENAAFMSGQLGSLLGQKTAVDSLIEFWKLLIPSGRSPDRTSLERKWLEGQASQLSRSFKKNR